MSGRVVAVGRFALLAIGVLSGVLPLLWTLSTSFKSQLEAQSYPPQLIPANPTLDNWSYLFGTADFISAVQTSVIVMLGATVLTLVVAVPCAYALIRLPMRGRRLLVLLVVFAQSIPGIVFLIPLYSLVVGAKLYDTPQVLIFVYAGFLTPFITLILASFVRSVPVEVEEAAFVDGARRWQVVWLVVLPMIRPGIATASIFTGLYAWNEFLIPVILGGETARPLTVYVASFVTQKTVEWGPLTAAVCAVLLPVVIVVVALQRQLVTGLTAGSIKG